MDKDRIKEQHKTTKELAHESNGLSELLCAKLDKWIDQCNENFRLLKDQGLTDLAAAHNAMAQAYWNVKQFIIENGA